MSPDEAREILKSKRIKGRPDAETANLLRQARELLSKEPVIFTKNRRGRPPNQVKVVIQRKKEKSFEDYPLATLYTKKGSPWFIKHLAKLSNEELRSQAKMSIREAKQLVATVKLKGRPSVLDLVKKIIAHELVKRFCKNSNLLTRKVSIRDRFKFRRKGMRRERREKRKVLPAPEVKKDPEPHLESLFNKEVDNSE